MALDYVAKAVRRFWPVVVGFVVLGVVGGQLLRPTSPPRYDSVALILVVPPSGSGQENVPGDRYVASQLVVFESPPLAARAAELAKVPLAAAQHVTFVQIAGTDVVRVIASSPTPADAQAIANAYLDAYVEQSEASSGGDSATTPSKLDRSLTQISSQLDAVDKQIQDAMAPYTQASKADSNAALPTIEQVAPAIATQREVLLDTYRNLLQQRTTLEFAPPAPTASHVIQRAELPTVAVVQSSRVVRLALPVLGLLLGVGVATVLARSSRRVLDGAEVTEALGVPFSTKLANEQTLRTRSLQKAAVLPPGYAAHVSELCVQAEARGEVDTPLSVVVTGAKRVAGSSTLAVSMAARFGELGSRVVLVDLDFDEPDISKCFGVRGDGISALVEMRNADHDMTSMDAVVFKSTPLPNVTVVGRQPDAADTRPQRAELLDAMEVALDFADVVIFDTGPILGSHAATVLAQQSDALVLAIPVRHQDRSALDVIARQVAPVKAHLLPVAMPTLKRSKRIAVSSSQAVARDDPSVELLYPEAS